MDTSRHDGFIRRGFQGGIAGAAATVVMSGALAFANWSGFMKKQPPRMIVETLQPELSSDTTGQLAVAAHLGYGSSAGAAYGAVVPHRMRGVATGVAYGIAVWAMGYEGWLPMMGVLPPAHRDKTGRALTMFAAHVVYGGTLGFIAKRLGR